MKGFFSCFKQGKFLVLFLFLSLNGCFHKADVNLMVQDLQGRSRLSLTDWSPEVTLSYTDKLHASQKVVLPDSTLPPEQGWAQFQDGFSIYIGVGSHDPVGYDISISLADKNIKKICLSLYKEDGSLLNRQDVINSKASLSWDPIKIENIDDQEYIFAYVLIDFFNGSKKYISLAPINIAWV